jgi:hypothetical protein
VLRWGVARNAEVAGIGHVARAEDKDNVVDPAGDAGSEELTSGWIFDRTDYDATAHISEEVKRAQVAAPAAISRSQRERRPEHA